MPYENIHKRRKLSISILGLVVMVFGIPFAALGAIIYNDGSVHNIERDLSFWDINVFDNIHDPYNPTTVNVLPGSNLNGLTFYESSIANINGGVTGYLSFENQSIANVNGGVMNTLSMNGESIVTINSGYIPSSINAGEHANIIFNNGNSSYLSTWGNSQAEIYGGIIEQFFLGGDSRIKMMGGAVSGSYFPNEAGILMTDNSYLEISGGQVNDGIRTAHNSHAKIYGTEFNLAAGTYTMADNPIYLIGTLMDGTEIDWMIDINDSSKLEIVPIPPAFLILGSGLIGLAAFRKKFIR